MSKSIHEEQAIQSHFDLALMRRLFGYAKAQTGILMFSVVLMTLVTLVDLSVPYFTKTAVDNYISPTHYTFIPVSVSESSADVITTQNSENTSSTTATTVNSAVIKATPANDPDTLMQAVVNGEYRLEKALEITGNAGEIGVDYDRETGVYTLLIGADRTKDISFTATDAFDLKLKDLRVSTLRHLVFVLVGFLLISLISGFLHTYFLNYASQKIVFALREKLFAHIEAQSLNFFDKNPVGRLVTRVSNDMNNINEMFTDVLVTSLKDFFLLAGTVIVMLSINAKLALYCFTTVPFVLIAARIFRDKARAVQREVKVKLAAINATLAENINGMKIIQIFNKEQGIYEAFDHINANYLSSSIKETKIYATFRPLMNLAYSVSLGMLIWFGSGDALSGVVELGVLIAFISYTQQFFRPIMDLTEKFNIFQSSMASAERIFLILDTENIIPNPTVPEIVPDTVFRGRIEFKHVWFSYEANPQSPEDYVLKDVSFTIDPGSSVAFVGATGSGKTTIINLINRFYDIQKGDILVDDIPIRKWDKSALREKIGMVLQDVFLFSGDIRENIRLNHPEITDEQIIKVAKYVNAHPFICSLPNGYDETVVERGATLSSGQRQLLSFARALVYDPKVLILDEATSNIDTETELLIQDAISKMIQNRTTLIVAHRLSTIQHVDQIVVMHKGEIKERGKHQDLLTLGGFYYDLYKLQYQENVS
ncbi:MAG: ATP-binding cassette, subfamily multidrug efflux pump [Clostridiales bacterium]|jgi:ATP-binding cassette subfamily B protein/subfamily B ATP-binding cassette protein MsbA|nr:ATP-binding cassette, subfamily multidrug efflux pump [Clostridiales bacterium]